LTGDGDVYAAVEVLPDFGFTSVHLTPEQIEEYRAARKELDKTFPPPRSTFEKFKEHLLYALELVGPEHVGMGADWDGGGGVDGMKDVVDLPKVTAALLDAGYSQQDIANIWGGNLMRVLREVEAARTSSLTSPKTIN